MLATMLYAYARHVDTMLRYVTRADAAMATFVSPPPLPLRYARYVTLLDAGAR